VNVIEIQNMNKVYKLYEDKKDRLKEVFSIKRHKYHKDFYALKDINLEVKKGEVLGIIGKNGAGKSTLLKIITGVLTPNSGKVDIQGKISALIELGAGFNPDYTGIENIYLYGTLMGLTKTEIDSRRDEIINFADIGDFIYQPVKSYSSGMFARLAFSVAINVDPDILIVDEALSVGDVFFQSKCYKKFIEFKEKGKTILFVTHDLGTILKYCDRAILIENGMKLEEGKPKEVIDQYKKIMVGLYDDKPEEVVNSFVNSGEVSKWNEAMETNKEKLVYGNLEAEIIDFCLLNEKSEITNYLEKGEFCTFKMKVQFNKTIKEPIFAMTIKDKKGTEIVGTNSQCERVETGITEKGSIIEVEFAQNIFLQGGEYLVSYGCTGYINDDFVVYHRLYDIYKVTIFAAKNTVGYYDMNTKMTIMGY
jgi:teichoic acid transport system ATP-binding protein